MSKIWFPGEDKLHQASTQEEMGSWNSGFKKIADMMPTAFRDLRRDRWDKPELKRRSRAAHFSPHGAAQRRVKPPVIEN
jgi:hypothetical protein